MISKSVISVALILQASLHTSYKTLSSCCAKFYCTVPSQTRELKASCYFLLLGKNSKSMGSAGKAFTAPLEGNYRHLSVRGQSGHRTIAWGSTDNSPIWEHNGKQNGQRKHFVRKTPVQWLVHNGVTCCKATNLFQPTASHQHWVQRRWHRPVHFSSTETHNTCTKGSSE